MSAPATISEPDRLLAMAPVAAVIRLAAPTTAVMVVGAVSNVVYTYFVSRLGADAIGAVSLVFPVSLLALTTMVGGIGAGTASAMARALGGGRREEPAMLAGQALMLSVAIGVAFGVAVQVVAPVLFRLMGATGVVHAQATVFARILFGGAAITFLGGMFDSVMRGEGNVRVPAIWSTTSLVLQMGCTPLFMFGLGWGLEGAALAMLACQALTTLPRAWWVLGGRGLVRPRLRVAPFTLAPAREILRVGIPAALSMSISNVGLIALTAVVARLGEAELAAYGLGTRFDFVLTSFGYGLGAAVLTLVAMASGARRPDRVHALVTRGVAMTVAILALPGLLLCVRPELWLGLFTADARIHTVGADYFHLIGPSYPFVGVSMVVGFAFQGLGRATIPLAWTVVRVASMLAIAIVCTQWLALGQRAVFATIAVANVASAGVMLALFSLGGRRRNPVQSADVAWEPRK